MMSLRCLELGLCMPSGSLLLEKVSESFRHSFSRAISCVEIGPACCSGQDLASSSVSFVGWIVLLAASQQSHL